MPIKLSDLNKTRTTTAHTQYGEVSITYMPSAYTAGIELLLAEAESKPAQTLVDLVKHLVIAWDIESDDGQPLAITQENLMMLPLDLLADILRAVTKDMRPNPTNSPA